MRQFFNQFSKDFRQIVFSPSFFVVAGFCCAIWSFVFPRKLFEFARSVGVSPFSQGGRGYNIYETVFISHLSLTHLLLMFIIPALTMRLIAEEKKLNTFSLLQTSPITSTKIVWAKFLASFSTVLILIFLSLLYPLMTRLFAQFNTDILFSAYFSIVLLASIYTAIGLFSSSLTQSIMLSLFLAFSLSMIFHFLRLEQMSDHPVYTAIMDYLVVSSHLNNFFRGNLTISSVLFFPIIAGFFVFLAQKMVESSNLAFSFRMSSRGKLFLAFSGVSLIIVALTIWVLGGWYPFLYVFLFFFFLGFLLNIFFDYKLYLSFLRLRTTRSGVSIGSSIFLAIILCVCLSYLSVRFDKSVDITEEGINSLAPQTTQLLNQLSDDMVFQIFYKGENGKMEKNQIKQNLSLYKKESSKVKVFYHNAYLKNALAQEYLNKIGNKESGNVFVFAEYKGKRVEIYVPFDEEKITSAIIKATRREEKVVYILYGHGERDFDSKELAGSNMFKEALTRSSFQVKLWNFALDGPLPSDASVLIIAGPSRPYLKNEVKWLAKYLEDGGRMMLSLDPGGESNLKSLLQKYDVEYRSYYILDQVATVLGLSRASPLGVHFDRENQITKSFPRGSFVIFHIAGDLKILEPVNSQFSITELVKTDARALAVPELKNTEEGEKSSHIIGLLINEKAGKKDEAEKIGKQKAKQKMILAVFGDSDFLSNQFFKIGGLNRDLALNTVSYLADESDLLNIRPKKLKTTQLTITKSQQMGLILFSILIPIAFFVCSFLSWFRRRDA